MARESGRGSRELSWLERAAVARESGRGLTGRSADSSSHTDTRKGHWWRHEGQPVKIAPVHQKVLARKTLRFSTTKAKNAE